MFKLCIILQGQLYPDIIDELFTTYHDLSNVIISTWDTEDIECINKCKERGFHVIVQPVPDYITQANYQVKSLSAGFKLATDLGYTHGFRCRTDIKINDIKKLLDLCKLHIPYNKLAFLIIFKNTSYLPAYLTDILAYGPLDKLSKYWESYQLPGDNRFPELFLMETYFNKSNILYDYIINEVELIGKLCYLNNIIIEFTKNKYRSFGNIIYRYYKYNCLTQSIQEREQLNII